MKLVPLFLFPALAYGQASTTLGANSLFNPDASRGLIGARTARNKGDILTVRVREVMKGTYTASTNSTKTVSDTIGAANIPLFDVFAGPVLGNILGSQAGLPQRILSSLTRGGSTNGTSSSAANGNSTTTGDFSANVSVIVTDVDSNGNLHIEGYRMVRVNKEIQKITLTGIVRVDDIDTFNTVASEKIANADLKADGKGVVADKTRQGILSKILGWLI